VPEDTIDVDTVERGEWSKCLSSFADASIYQTWDYVPCVFPDERVTRLVLRRGDEVVAMAQGRIVTLPLVARGIAHFYWAPVWRKKGGGDDPRVLERLLSAVKDEYAAKRRLLVRLVPNVLCDEGRLFTDALDGAGFKRVESIRPHRTMVLDITPSPDGIRKGFAQKWRNCLNRSQRNNLEMTAGTSQKQYGEFLSLYDELMGRKNFDTSVDARRWGAFEEALPEPEKMRVLIARREGRAVAAAVFSTVGEKGIYLLGASNEEGLKLQGAYLLQWRAIEMMREAGCSLYDLGGIDPEENPGVYHFKAGLKGRDVTHVGTYEYCDSALSRSVVAVGEKLRTIKIRLVGRRSPHGN